MPNDEPRKAEEPTQPPKPSTEPEPNELSDDDLKPVSGGLGSLASVGLSDDPGCISRF